MCRLQVRLSSTVSGVFMGYEWLALAAASLWAIAALISVKPARHLGPLPTAAGGCSWSA